MKTKALENSVRIIDYQSPKVGELDIINELYNPEQDIEKNFIEPFSKELTKNLLNKENQDGIRIILKHYIRVFSRAKLFFDNYKKILFDNNYLGNGTDEYSTPQFWKNSKLSKFENYVIISYYIYNCHFYDIQDCCITYKIDFFELCRELHFNWDLISTGITKSYKETEDLIHYKNELEKVKQPPTHQIETNPIELEQNYEQILLEIRSSDNKLWKGLPMETVFKHFEVMTIKKNKTGNVYLTVEQLISFLKKGFLNDQTQPKQKINCVSGEKGFVIKRFYDLYNLAVSQYEFPRIKKDFIKLFNDCFNNWDPKTIKPFFKPNKTINEW